MAVNINANPGKITELAAIIKDSYLAIDNETSILNSRLKSFANTLDDETYCLIKNKVEALLVKISESEDSVKTIYENLVQYAEAVEISQRELNLK